jgi:hypothetical protein
MTTLSRPTLSLKRSATTVRATSQRTMVASLQLVRFFFVWAPDGQRPKKRHATAEAAHTEAARLRTIAPERQFLVYEARRLDGELHE